MIKKSKSKLFILSIIIALLVSLFQSNIYATQSYPYITGKSGLALEYNTGTVLYEKNMNEVIYPASTTKMLTALVVKSKLDLASTITAPDNFPKIGGTSINIVPGETFTVEQLLNAIIIRSGNDAATLLALSVSGTVEDFAELMNTTAQSLGCTSSSFVNPSGLHDPNHYTTALDMSKIATAFLNDSTLKEIAGKSTYTIPATNKKAERVLTNTNKFLTGENFQIENNGTNIPVIYDIVDGLKTGTTPEAGNCLVSTAQKNNLRVISLVFGSTEASVYADSKYMLDYGLDNYKRTEVIPADSVLKTLKKPFAQPETVDFKISEGYSYVEPITSSARIEGKANFDKIKMPLEAGQKVGTYKIEDKDSKTVLAEIPIYASTSYESKLSWNYLGKSTFGKIFRVILLLLIIATVFFAIVYGVREHNLKKKRAQRRQRRQREGEKRK